MASKGQSDLDEEGRRRTLAPTSLAQYLSLDSCDRFLRFYLYKGQTQALVRQLSEVGLHQRRALQPIGPLMADLGDRIEAGVLEALEKQGYPKVDLTDQDVAATLRAIEAVGPQPTYLYQAQVAGRLGPWLFEGRADLLRVHRQPATGQLQVTVGDVKATRKDKVQHRLQVATYVRLLQGMLSAAGLQADFAGTVVRRDADGTLQDPETALRFDLEPYFSALDQLAVAPDSALARVNETGLADLHYYINQRCDGCLFNPVCMVESAGRQDVALVPFLESADKRVLVQHGIRSVSDLAGLKELPVKPPESDAAPVYNRQLSIVPGREEVAAALAETWPIGPRLDRLIQRAIRMQARRFGAGQNQLSYSFFFDSARSVLPDDKEYPDLVKIFLDVQTDYLEERVYLAGAHIVGPGGSRSLVQMTPGVPTAETERALLVGWVSQILLALGEVARDPTATPLHLYLYNRHDQRFLLEALRRHLDVFATLPALYNLLTETPALTQSAVSFLYDEVKEQRNLASTGHTLQAVATQLGFKWQEGDLLYYRLFEQGMFDYLLQRTDDGRYIESAARFYSSIPLEYAYAAWGVFKETDFKPQVRPQVRPYLLVTAQNLRQFQAKRLEALAYIESRFTRKNRFIRKEPLDLTALGAGAAHLPPFRRVLEEFLYIEHYANLQEHLELFGQPITRRVQAGRALLVRCIGLEDRLYRNKTATLAHFEADFSGTGLEPGAALQLNKLKTGDFVVVNGLEKEGRAWEIVRGRIGIVAGQDGARISVDLSDMTFFSPKNAAPRPTVPFRYSHDNKLRPEAGELYSLDEMVDDLNGDKLLEACRNAEANPFYHLLAAPTGGDDLDGRRPLPAGLTLKADEFAALVRNLEGEFAPTEAQTAVIAGHLARRIFLVQGPPGTGKSHTLGWAVLARMYAARALGGTLRVAVSCQTHNAVNIVLQSIAGKLARLEGTAAEPLLADLRLYKTGGDENEGNTGLGVEPLEPWEQRHRLSAILKGPLVVIGGTPGGLHKLMKQQTKNRPESLWEEKLFDLVILDEASQMNLPQALLATSWLGEDGQLIVVGDHRQMAPILTHSWAEEDRLTSLTTQPYRSVFQYLVDQGFPRVALDESFRLHRVQAAFLNEQIYRHDGINFHSRRQNRLPECADPTLSPYLRAVLDPAYPVVVIQHEERGSQQANPTEAALLAPIVQACTEWLGLDGAEGIGVVVPHRAQKALLRGMFPRLADRDAVDTVERFQGDEREVIIVSATASDPDYVLAEAEFLLNPNRLNVALSRPRKKLIVVASAVVFQFLSADLEIFDQAVLWKRLLTGCATRPLWAGPYAGTTVKVFGCQA